MKDAPSDSSTEVMRGVTAKLPALRRIVDGVKSFAFVHLQEENEKISS